MKKIHYLDSIISPNVTEKSTSMSEFNKVVFKVDKKANKKIDWPTKGKFCKGTSAI